MWYCKALGGGVNILMGKNAMRGGEWRRRGEAERREAARHARPTSAVSTHQSDDSGDVHTLNIS